MKRLLKLFTKNPNAKIKPMMMKIQGMSMKKSLGYLGKGEMSLVTEDRRGRKRLL